MTETATSESKTKPPAKRKKRKTRSRAIRFSFAGETFNWSITKVERRQLYGSVSLETRTTENSVCDLATLAYDGRTVIPYGGTALGYMNPDGLWLSRDQLSPVDLDGAALDTVESTFKLTNALSERVSVEDFLDHSVRLCYRLTVQPTDTGDTAETDTVANIPAALLTELADGVIFKIPFSYRGGINPDPAFLLHNEAGHWLLVADANHITYAGLAEAAACARPAEPEEAKEDSEEIDFGML